MQPGPMYFLCPRKCGLFAVTCDGMPQQVTNVIDEGMCISKDGVVEVPQANWQSFLRPFFRLMKGIKQYHHFRFDETQPGVVFRQEYSDSEEERYELLLHSEVLPPPHRPQPVPLSGLDNSQEEITL